MHTNTNQLKPSHSTVQWSHLSVCTKPHTHTHARTHTHTHTHASIAHEMLPFSHFNQHMYSKSSHRRTSTSEASTHTSTDTSIHVYWHTHAHTLTQLHLLTVEVDYSRLGLSGRGSGLCDSVFFQLLWLWRASELHGEAAPKLLQKSFSFKRFSFYLQMYWSSWTENKVVLILSYIKQKRSEFETPNSAAWFSFILCRWSAGFSKCWHKHTDNLVLS